MEQDVAVAEVHMEEFVEENAGMAGVPRIRENLHGDVLLAPDSDIDGRSSAASGIDVLDRLTYLEQRVQMQEDELQLLKMTLANVLKRLNISEEHQAALSRKPSARAARPVSLALPVRPTTTSSTATLKKSNTLPSTMGSRNYSSSPSSKSTARSPVSSVKDSPGSSGSTSRSRTAAASTTSTCRRLPEKKPKETGATLAGTRRVTHCKVTMQIFLSPQSKRTGSSELEVSTPVVITEADHTSPPPTKPMSLSDRSRPIVHKISTFALPLQKIPRQNSYASLVTPSYKSPIKSPSQYFQICY
ncbi:A-agglutinin anchorage subunit [Denticeps clupeoides]|uniref:A-agglutinin anchorage subunit n=1 Tax=Denticeps clupeoides TaxID=299321 RepID=UPI0010A45183|nr:A-agglutinin anchorage subunit-like [Denticeps clupeoides]